MKKALTLLLATILWVAQAHAATIEQDVDRYLASLTTDSQGTMLESLAWAGISSPRLYDEIERILVDVVASRSGSKADARKYGNYIRALGFSGQAKYIPTLQALKANRRYDNYAIHALNDQALYQKWNPIISNRATFNPQRSDDANRLVNMLSADDLPLNRLASKRIYAGMSDVAVYDALEKRVRANYSRTGLSESDQDSVAWMVKALGNSKMEKYRELLIQVAQTSPIDNAVRHAERTLERDYATKLGE